MKVIGEYLKLIPKGLPNSVEIVKAIVNNVQMSYNNLPENQKDEIIRRRFICNNCPFMSKNAISSKEYKELTGENYNTLRTDEHCSFCGCQIKTRTAALNSNCGISAWNKENPHNILKLKWDKYNEQRE
jgi:hypothetical protein